MIKNQFSIFLVFYSICLLLLSGCKQENCNDPANPECPNYDPCLKYKNLNADFSIKEILRIDADRRWEVETDTCWVGNMIKFSVKSPYLDSVKWLIGAEVLKDTVVYRRYFPEYINEPITLIAYYKSHIACIGSGDSDGVDTVVKYLYTEPQLDDLPVNGVYVGYNTDSPAVMFTIQVNDTSTNRKPSPGQKTPYGRSWCIQNLPKGEPDLDWIGNHFIAWGGRHFFYKENSKDTSVATELSNFFLRCNGSLNNGVLTVDYTYDGYGLSNYLTGTAYTRRRDVTKRFIGYKIRSY